MNTLEIKKENIVNSFEDFYKVAKKQFYDYEKLEGISNWKKYDFSIDCSEDQIKFKDMLQIRFIEELTEASAAIEEKEHFWEEITDALNFFISAYIMVGTDFNKLPKPSNYLSKESNPKVPDFINYSIKAYGLVHRVGYLCNLLKNRPWAQSNYLVSMVDFNERFEDLWVSFWKFLGDLGLSEQDIFDLFERKVLVNRWRIKTGY